LPSDLHSVSSAISAALEKKKIKMANIVKVQSTITAHFQAGTAVATTKAIPGTAVLSKKEPPPMSLKPTPASPTNTTTTMKPKSPTNTNYDDNITKKLKNINQQPNRSASNSPTNVPTSSATATTAGEAKLAEATRITTSDNNGGPKKKPQDQSKLAAKETSTTANAPSTKPFLLIKDVMGPNDGKSGNTKDTPGGANIQQPTLSKTPTETAKANTSGAETAPDATDNFESKLERLVHSSSDSLTQTSQLTPAIQPVFTMDMMVPVQQDYQPQVTTKGRSSDTSGKSKTPNTDNMNAYRTMARNQRAPGLGFGRGVAATIMLDRLHLSPCHSSIRPSRG
jgi:hypothetical protein